MSQDSLFVNRTAILTTKHQKEAVIAPLLQDKLGIQVQVPPDVDTDRFGSFTRDVKRPGTQRETARIKANHGLDLTGESLGLASEGSFSPHPAMPFLPHNREMVLLIDREQDLEVVGEAITVDTNYNHKLVHSVDEALAFAEKAGFPTHGVVVMSQATPMPSSVIVKGLVDEKALIQAVEAAIAQSPEGTAHLETDMRAMFNPTRMTAIAKATEDLIHKLQQQCPQCGCPGFSTVKRIPGLPCSLCQMPTSLIREAIAQCQRCGYEETIPFPDGSKSADPTYCNYCNP